MHFASIVGRARDRDGGKRDTSHQERCRDRRVPPLSGGDCRSHFDTAAQMHVWPDARQATLQLAKCVGRLSSP